MYLPTIGFYANEIKRKARPWDRKGKHSDNTAHHQLLDRRSQSFDQFPGEEKSTKKRKSKKRRRSCVGIVMARQPTRSDTGLASETENELAMNEGEDDDDYEYDEDVCGDPPYCDDDGERVTLNVGGTRHETFLKALAGKPGTRLGKLADFLQRNTMRQSEYFFNRHPGVFNSVIDYYRSGEFHVPLDVCGAVVKRELNYWQIDESLIEPCCWTCYSHFIDNQNTLSEFNASFEAELAELEAINALTGWDRKLMKIWMTLDHPRSSKLALVYAVTSFIFVLTSICGFCLETLPIAKSPVNVTGRCFDNGTQTLMETHETLKHLDHGCTAFFTLELIVRVIFAPNKKAFFFSVMNIIDILALLPLYMQILLDLMDKYTCLQNSRAVLETIFILRIVRIFRIFHLVKHYSALKILVHAIKASVQELLMLSIFLVIAMLVFATLVFYAESPVNPIEQNSDFDTIPIGFWWAIITMTTVGYGDVFPETALGQSVGVLCAVSGVLLIALTIPVISNNFSLFYLHGRTRQEMTSKKRGQLLEDSMRDEPTRKVAANGKETKRSGMVTPLLADSNSEESGILVASRTQEERLGDPSENPEDDDDESETNV